MFCSSLEWLQSLHFDKTDLTPFCTIKIGPNQVSPISMTEIGEESTAILVVLKPAIPNVLLSLFGRPRSRLLHMAKISLPSKMVTALATIWIHAGGVSGLPMQSLSWSHLFVTHSIFCLYLSYPNESALMCSYLNDGSLLEATFPTAFVIKWYAPSLSFLWIGIITFYDHTFYFVQYNTLP